MEASNPILFADVINLIKEDSSKLFGNKISSIEWKASGKNIVKPFPLPLLIPLPVWIDPNSIYMENSGGVFPSPNRRGRRKLGGTSPTWVKATV